MAHRCAAFQVLPPRRVQGRQPLSLLPRPEYQQTLHYLQVLPERGVCLRRALQVRPCLPLTYVCITVTHFTSCLCCRYDHIRLSSRGGGSGTSEDLTGGGRGGGGASRSGRGGAKKTLVLRDRGEETMKLLQSHDNDCR